MTSGSWADQIAAVPEPDELVAQCDAIATERERGAVLCTTCGRPRSLHGFKASDNGPACVFKEGTEA